MKVAIIPARGGSKRIPRKNIKDFNGKAMIGWSIEAALLSGVFDEVWVSTDDAEIASIAQSFGAKVPFIRPTELSDDHTGTSAVVRHAISWALQHQLNPGLVACIYATAPLLQPLMLKEAMLQLQQDIDLDYVFSGCRFSFPIQRALYRDDAGAVAPVQPDAIGKRSQDLAETFHDAGQLYWATADTWLDSSKAVFGTGSRMLLLPAHLVQDIDTAEDWQRAELLYQLLQAPAQ